VEAVCVSTVVTLFAAEEAMMFQFRSTAVEVFEDKLCQRVRR